MKLRSIFSPSIALLSVAASVGVATVFTNAAPASALAGPVTLGFVCDTTGFGAGSPPQIPPSVGTACLTGANQFSAVVSHWEPIKHALLSPISPVWETSPLPLRILIFSTYTLSSRVLAQSSHLILALALVMERLEGDRFSPLLRTPPLHRANLSAIKS